MRRSDKCLKIGIPLIVVSLVIAVSLILAIKLSQKANPEAKAPVFPQLIELSGKTEHWLGDTECYCFPQGLVQDNDIYWLDKIGGRLHKITNNGKENELFNGVPDWVYEEDVTYSNSAMWFSPDGHYLVFVQSNDTHVKWFPYMWYGKDSAFYTKVKRIAYPKPGSPNPVVTIKIVDLQKLPPNVTDTPNSKVLLPPAEFRAVEHYYTNVAWASNSSVMIWWLNRVQNKSIASICKVTSASCTENQNLQVKNGWVDIKSYLSSSDKATTFLTKGTWEVTRILAFNDETETVSYRVYVKGHFMLVKCKCIFKALKPLLEKVTYTDGDCKFFTASFSPGASWYVLNCHATWYKELQMNEGLQKKLSELSTPKRRNFVIPAGEYELLATEFLPPDFDENKKYAVLFDVFMQKKPYVDPKRLSVWGWSFGGFLTTYVLSKNTGVFNCGIAVAPVTDWRYYDSAYTERYMGLPEDNANGYKDTSLLSRAANFSNVDFLIIHGSGDDNVHYQHTAQMVKALTEAEVKFRVQVTVNFPIAF
ncbi:PREDICTED: dipeptidyl peptidase 4-like [Acropora digitifera]|uniref:dipeptidyl peptidase 4-like n=1 Tax=Acropora digitifera TaxID=70779 RepID=UPI00077A2501|nr:PREDICTED: dipeptidyl peptidase 4-like [Acropora digitifera]